MMIDTCTLKRAYCLKESVGSAVVRAHLCTVAVSLSFTSVWWGPSAALRLGGLAYGLALTAAQALLVTPVALLQLAAGQVSQQDAVGIWRAVPLFRGVGYLKLLITYLAAIYTVTYCALITVNIFSVISAPIFFWKCDELPLFETIDGTTVFNQSVLCNNFDMTPEAVDETQYLLATSLLGGALWISLPFMLFSPVKYMKRIFFVLGPLVLILIVIILSNLGRSEDLASIQKGSDWPNFLNPDIWHAALIQALWSSQVAGGYLVSSADTVYRNLNVQWAAVAVAAITILANWLGILFWFAIGATADYYSESTILYEVYDIAEEKKLGKAWLLMILITLLISGVITMLTQMFPLFDRFRRAARMRWRLLAMGACAAGACASVAALALGQSSLRVLDAIAVPLLITITTVLEILPLIYIYGWKVLVEDVEFLIGRELGKVWPLGWCVAPGVVAPIAAWWATMLVLQEDEWLDPPYIRAVLVATAALALAVFSLVAVIAVAKQQQYDCFSKLKSSLKPSRQWGPRDPITHYYWLARREEAERGIASRYLRRVSGQFAHFAKFDFYKPTCPPASALPSHTHRSHSDDVIYSIYRKEFVRGINRQIIEKEYKKRSKSLDFSAPRAPL